MLRLVLVGVDFKDYCRILGGMERRPREDITGHVFGRLTVQSFAGYFGTTKAKWSCDCSCGERGVVVFGYNLKNGNTESCGCVRVERSKERNTTHGMTETRIYAIWCDMIGRCYNENKDDFDRYGGRGIRVCDRWRGDDGFVNFLSDMGDRPSQNLSIDREDVNGDYCPDNCRWATQKQQQRNRRDNRIITFRGVTACLAEHCERENLPYSRTLARLDHGWSTERAFTEPPHYRGR